MYKDMNLYEIYFVSKGTGPETVQVEAQNSAGAKAQVEARCPGAYNITLNQLPSSANRRKRTEDGHATVDGLEHHKAGKVLTVAFSAFHGHRLGSRCLKPDERSTAFTR